MGQSIFNQFWKFENKKNVLFLFPSYFKIIGLSIAVPALFALVFQFEIHSGQFHERVFKLLLILGTFVFTLSKEKYEDERTRDLRFRAFAFSVVLLIGIQVVFPSVMLLFSLTAGDFNPKSFEPFDSYKILFMLLVAQASYFHKFKKEL
jgi:hypothetical protein